jgi:hypothetical protein
MCLNCGQCNEWINDVLWKRKQQRTRDLILSGFDEVWYNNKYSLTMGRPRGLEHYLKIGAKAGYSPNAIFDEEFYLSIHSDIASEVQAGAFLSGYDHYTRHGRLENRACHGPKFRLPLDYSHLLPLFDEDWYDHEYGLKDAQPHGFKHYLLTGARKGFSPHAEFDERFYISFYNDAGHAVSSRSFLCGYEHYVVAGRAEGRLTKHNLTKILDLKYPGLTDPIGIAEARQIERRLTPIHACSGEHEERYWILVPSLDPDIFFGGYKALIELVVGLASLTASITVVVCGQSYDDGSYFRHWSARQERIAAAFENIQIVSGASIAEPLCISPSDKIFAYSAWEAHLAHKLAAYTESGLFAWLVQEYEPIFQSYSAEHALVANAYRLPHYPIFNSMELKDYFRHNRLGVFAGEKVPVPQRDFAVFGHVLTNLKAPTLIRLKNRHSKTLILYARPEAHAKRNLFPLALIALNELVQEGSFVGSWEFHGLGALAETTIPLGQTYKLNLHAKMTEKDYVAFMDKIDVGLSLMYAPHPGLVAFEMASAGALVVTNTFDNRSATYLRGLSENVIPCEPTISGIKQALILAIASSNDFAARIRGAQISYCHSARSWSEVFDEKFFRYEMSGFLGTCLHRN